jgi:soluble lytic murein transglycosylase
MNRFLKVLVVFLGLSTINSPQVEAQGCTGRLREALTYKNLNGALTLFQDKKCVLEKKILLWHYMRDGSQEPSFAQYTEFYKAHPSWPWMFKVRRGAESRLQDGTPEKEILTWFEEGPVKTLEGASALLTILSKNNPKKAREKAQEIWQEISLAPEETTSFLKNFGALVTPEDHLKRARTFLAKGDMAPAKSLIKHVAPTKRPLLEACVALMSGDKNGRKIYQKIHNTFKDDLDLRLAYLIWLRKTTTLEGAKYLLRHPRLASYAPAPVWKEAHILLRRALEKGERPLAARLSAMGESTSGEDYAQAQWLKGYFALDTSPKEAFQIFEKAGRSMSSPISRARFAYWSGRALEKSGDPKAAADWYKKASRFPSTFYGQLAAHDLDIALPAPAPLSLTPALLDQFRKDERYRAAQVLFKLGRERDGSDFLFMMIKNTPSLQERLAILKLAAGLSPTQAVGLAKEASIKGEVYCQEAYPCLGDIHSQAIKEVDPTLLHAVIRKESSFNSRTISSAGAVGLTQMLPSTAKEVAKKINLPYSEDRLLNDDPFNVRVGARYLQTRLDEFGDNEILALVSYNAGIKYALEWQTMFGDPRTTADPVEWMELLPFGETRNYVHRVLEAKWVYERLLPGEHPASSAREVKRKGFGEGLKARVRKNRTKSADKESSSAKRAPLDRQEKLLKDVSEQRTTPSQKSVQKIKTEKTHKTPTRAQLKSHGRRKEAQKGHSLQGGRPKRHEKGATPKGRPSKERTQSV